MKRIAILCLSILLLVACGGEGANKGESEVVNEVAPTSEPTTELEEIVEDANESESEVVSEDEPADEFASDEPVPTLEPTPDLPGNSRDDPVLFGEVLDLAGVWEFKVLSLEEGNQIVIDENEFNDPPEEGKRFVILRVWVKYLGDVVGRDITKVG